MSAIQEWTALAGQGVEVLAVVLMVSLIAIETARWLRRPGQGLEAAYPRYRATLGKSLLIGLELLVAADIIRTIAVELTFVNIAQLGALVVVRTFLSWALTVEVDGRWPWQVEQETVRNRDK